MIVQGKSYWASIKNAFSNLNKITDTLYMAEINQQKINIAVFTHPSTPDNIHNWGRDAKTPYLLDTVVPTIKLIRQELLIEPGPKGEHIMPPISETSPQPFHSQSEKPDYDFIFEQIKAGLIERFLPEITYRKPKFEHSTPNRMRIYMDRVTGSHYQITFMRDRYEFALHFESTPAMSLQRRQAFDPYVQDFTRQIGISVKTGKIENKGWMGVWYDRKLETIDLEKIKLYVDQYSRFIAATFPILLKLYN